MHNAISTLLSIFFLSTTTTCSARNIPQPPHPSPRSLTPPPSSLANKCTFTLWHKQLPAHQTNYIRIPSLTDHANNLTIDISHLRPTAEFNSYSKISATRVFAIEGLLEGRNLTVRGQEGRDEVRFESHGVGWSSEEGGREAWCQVGEWDESRNSRERRMECAFPCEKIEGEEGEDEEEGEEERVEL